MNKALAIICFVSGLQPLSLIAGSPTAKPELLVSNPIYTVQPDSITDIDGNVYHVVKIGKQLWMQENLKTAHFRNGSAIAELEYDWPLTGTWADHSETGYPAWCYYERDKENNYKDGKLYNWYAVTDSQNVCPTGYHVPSDEEFQVLSDFLGGDNEAGGHMKSVELWDEKDSTYADNTSGFTGLPSGIRYKVGSFIHTGTEGTAFWTTTRYDRLSAWCRVLYFGGLTHGSNLGHHNYDKRSGRSVRCVGD
jgi:uncharacterized protein (TIGR02145 family)